MSHRPQLRADMVYKIGLTAEFRGRMNTAIHADTSGEILAPDKAAKPIKMMGTCGQAWGNKDLNKMALRIVKIHNCVALRC